MIIENAFRYRLLCTRRDRKHKNVRSTQLGKLIPRSIAKKQVRIFYWNAQVEHVALLNTHEARHFRGWTIFWKLTHRQFVTHAIVQFNNIFLLLWIHFQ